MHTSYLLALTRDQLNEHLAKAAGYAGCHGAFAYPYNRMAELSDFDKDAPMRICSWPETAAIMADVAKSRACINRQITLDSPGRYWHVPFTHMITVTWAATPGTPRHYLATSHGFDIRVGAYIEDLVNVHAPDQDIETVIQPSCRYFLALALLENYNRMWPDARNCDLILRVGTGHISDHMKPCSARGISWHNPDHFTITTDLLNALDHCARATHRWLVTTENAAVFSDLPTFA